MDTLNFDFRPPSSRASMLGIALLIGGVIALSASLFNMQQANEAHAARSREAATFEQAQQKRAPNRARFTRSRSTGDIAQVARARVRSDLDYSWQPAFAALEATHSPSIALVSLEGSQQKKQVRLVAEARRLSDAVNYAERLGRQNGVKRTSLMQHQVQEKDAQRPVRFTLLMEMRP